MKPNNDGIQFTTDELYLIADTVEFTLECSKDSDKIIPFEDNEAKELQDKYIAFLEALLQHIQNYFDQETTDA